MLKPMAHPLIGESAGMRALRCELAAIAKTRSTVLVTGETGTGKGLVARRIHELSGGSPFVHVDCAALSAGLIESELFGHEQGAFTGASERRVGRLEQAEAGTLFLDELSELPPGLQAKLLRVLQDRTFESVGGARTQVLRARVVAASNRDLREEIAAGRFRADLYYRLQVFEVRVPPLRARRSDLSGLVRFLAARRGAVPALSACFQARLEAHDWPGNVRELANLVERLQVRKPVGPWLGSDVEGLVESIPFGSESPAPAARERFRVAEREALEGLLVAHGWNVSAAARSLGVSRGALRGRMARIGL